MLIRSQDKKTIVNLNNIDTICAKGDEESNKVIKEHYRATIEYYNGGEETMGTLGKYSAEEKAIKVLDMIFEKYGTYMAIGNEFNGVQGYYDMPKIFQMPQDSEV